MACWVDSFRRLGRAARGLLQKARLGIVQLDTSRASRYPAETRTRDRGEQARRTAANGRSASAWRCLSESNAAALRHEALLPCQRRKETSGPTVSTVTKTVATKRLGDREPPVTWSGRRDSNPRPPPWQG